MRLQQTHHILTAKLSARPLTDHLFSLVRQFPADCLLALRPSRNIVYCQMTLSYFYRILLADDKGASGEGALLWQEIILQAKFPLRQDVYT